MSEAIGWIMEQVKSGVVLKSKSAETLANYIQALREERDALNQERDALNQEREGIRQALLGRCSRLEASGVGHTLHASVASALDAATMRAGEMERERDEAREARDAEIETLDCLDKAVRRHTAAHRHEWDESVGVAVNVHRALRTLFDRRKEDAANHEKATSNLAQRCVQAEVERNQARTELEAIDAALRENTAAQGYEWDDEEPECINVDHALCELAQRLEQAEAERDKAYRLESLRRETLAETLARYGKALEPEHSAVGAVSTLLAGWAGRLQESREAQKEAEAKRADLQLALDNLNHDHNALAAVIADLGIELDLHAADGGGAVLPAVGRCLRRLTEQLADERKAHDRDESDTKVAIAYLESENKRLEAEQQSLEEQLQATARQSRRWQNALCAAAAAVELESAAASA